MTHEKRAEEKVQIDFLAILDDLHDTLLIAEKIGNVKLLRDYIKQMQDKIVGLECALADMGTEKDMAEVHVKELESITTPPASESKNKKIIRLHNRIHKLTVGLEKIIEMNRREAKDRYGDEDKAESWACVKVARESLPAPYTPEKGEGG